jgi:hypothetical protein
LVKSLLLGSAAGVVAMTGAQAADLPVKAKPVQYVKICSLYGAGFWYIPGTNTCIKLGGWIRTEYNINAGGSFNPNKTALYSRENTQNAIRNRGIMTWDVREQTEYGTLRGYIAGGWQNTNGDYVTNGIYAPRAFIQFAGFTLGKATSFYDFYATPWYSNTTNVWGSDTGGSGKIVWGYTAQFGNGLSASLAAEDPTYTQNGILGTSYTSGPDLPDLTMNLHLDANWGMAQIMGALHQVNAVGEIDGDHPSDKVGWAIGAGLKVNLPWGKGDSFAIEGDYTQGASKYAGSGIGNFLWCRDRAGYSPTPKTGDVVHYGGSCGFGTASDAAMVGNGDGTLDLTTAWSVVAGMDHHWNAHWKTSLYGTYGQVSYSGETKDEYFNGLDSNFSFAQIGSRTVWNPVAHLDLSVDVMYLDLKTAQTGAAPCNRTDSGVCSDQSAWQAILRAQYNFYP